MAWRSEPIGFDGEQPVLRCPDGVSLAETILALANAPGLPTELAVAETFVPGYVLILPAGQRMIVTHHS